MAHKAEILAPCGSFEALEAALRSGCDAVYLGGEKFSARQNAANFTDEQLKEAVRLCHLRGVKVYQAINTVVFDEQLEECKKAVKFAAEIGVDGLITQDLTLVKICRECCPDLEYHASTQMTIHSESGVKIAKNLGFSRAVLSRELPEHTIKDLTALGIETEVFVHGALCMSVSGQCYMSALIGSRSANRGLCAQACRLPAQGDKITKGQERYALSLKDMSYVDKLQRLENDGVSSLKIEGRMKRPEYVAAAVNCCKNSLENKPYDLKALEAVFSRGGFTDGYYNGRLGREMFGTRQKEDVSATAKILPELHELYRRCEKRTKAFFTIKLQESSPAELSLRDSEGNTVSVERTIYTDYSSKYVGDDGTVYTTDDEVYFTDENGKTWQALNDDTHYMGAELGQHVLEDADGNSVTVTETTNGDYYYRDDNGTGFTDNGDGTWSDENGNSYNEMN